MKFIVKRELMVDGFTKVGKAVSGKSSIPVLQGFLLEVTQEEINITGSDSSETIKHCIPVDGENVIVHDSGSIILPKQIENIVKKSNKQIEFSLDGFTTKVKSGKSEFDIICLDATDYPKFPEYDLSTPSLQLEGEQFRDLIKKTAFAASTSETRPVLQGICIEVSAGNVNLVCTDSHRLSRIIHKAQAVQDARIVVPAKTLDNMSKVFDLDKEVHVFIQNEQHILLRNGQTYYISRLLNDNYPDTSRLIPNDSDGKLKINRQEIVQGLELIKEIANASDGDKQGVVKLHVNGVASLSSQQAQKGKGKIDLPYDSFEGEELTISFDCKYALDALKSMDCETVNMSFNGAMRPFLIEPDGEVALAELQLILPVRTM
ncbi:MULTISPECIES: DNA polymerase III subunit beta [Metabacillus]|uniref:DNA polymerase III subunit beta n=1 Tax=Metabacillus TaxID=2675233 RepID=UPI00158C0BF7|nr:MULTISPECIES: DNA polymerase III subunit beta [Metabacillus]MCM3443604.1 DNA polymerase III subunit beta [Metabacillus halosaccharovorans]